MFRLLPCLTLFCLYFSFSSNVYGQNGVFDDVFATDGVPQFILRPNNVAADDWCMEVASGLWNMDSPSNNNIIEVNETAPSQSLVLRSSRVEINRRLTLGGTTVPGLELNDGTDQWELEVGSSVFNLDGPNSNNIIEVEQTAQTGSIVVGGLFGGITLGYETTVEANLDVKGDVTVNNSVAFDQTSGPIFVVGADNDVLRFDSSGAIRPLQIFNNAASRGVAIAENGIGIGTENPVSPLHVLADGTGPFGAATIRAEVTNNLSAQDRTMLDLRNNGAIVMNLFDTSSVGGLPYQIRTASDRMSFQQFGGNRAGMIIFGDGSIRYVANGAPNLTVTPNGNLNLIGQAGGGNLNVIGPAGGAGNLFVKGNIVYQGTISGPSDRNIKENFQEIDPQEILMKVANLPITKWNYIDDEKDTAHLGPMAQDFFSAFGLGDDPKRIPLMDNSGVALAAIKGLNQIVEAKEKEIVELSQTLREQNELILELNERMQRLESLVIPSQN